MKTWKFNKLLKYEDPKKILSDYMSCKIWLTDKQLEKVCNKNDGHGGVAWGTRKKVKK